MNWALAAAGILISWILVAFATWVYLHPVIRAANQPKVTHDDANQAIVDCITTSLREYPDRWIPDGDGLVHISGTSIEYCSGKVVISSNGTRSTLPNDLAGQIIAAAQERNAKAMLIGLTENSG